LLKKRELTTFRLPPCAWIQRLTIQQMTILRTTIQQTAILRTTIHRFRSSPMERRCHGRRCTPQMWRAPRARQRQRQKTSLPCSTVSLLAVALQRGGPTTLCRRVVQTAASGREAAEAPATIQSLPRPIQ